MCRITCRVELAVCVVQRWQPLTAWRCVGLRGNSNCALRGWDG